MAYRGKDLAGTNGIPAHDERVYVEVALSGDRLDGHAVRPTSITWPDGRSWRLESARPTATFGREIFGNLVVRYDVTIGRSHRTLWRDGRGWFVKRRL